MTRYQTLPRGAAPVAGFVLRGLLRAAGLGLLGLVVILGAVGLRSLPLAGQLWNRPELARTGQHPVPVHAAAKIAPAEVPFVCC